jgi:uncharacterized protein involved in exopolysaccharide biosynthesis
MARIHDLIQHKSEISSQIDALYEEMDVKLEQLLKENAEMSEIEKEMDAQIKKIDAVVAKITLPF